MEEKKNIDRLFQERFKDFESMPDEHVWQQIETSLDKKRKKRRGLIPLWLRYGGIAATIVLLVAVGYNSLSDENPPQEVIVEQTEADELPTNENAARSENSTDEHVLRDASDSNSAIADEKTSDTPEELSAESRNASLDDKDNARNTRDALVTNNTAADGENNSTKTDRSKADVLSNNQQATIREAVASKDGPFSDDTSTQQKAEKEAVATADDAQNSFPKTSSSLVSIEKDKVQEDAVTKQAPPSILKERILSPELEKRTDTSEDIAARNTQEPEQPSLEEVAKQQETETLFEGNDLENVVAEDGKWRVRPTIAPVYFNTLENGSPIHSQFASNSKSGDINMSYGVHVSYAVGKRLDLRSGVNLVTVGYGTENVNITPEISSVALATIDYNENARSVTLMSGNSARGAVGQVALESSISNTGSLGTMNQEMNYVEVPLEMSYALVDNTFAINVIAGASTLFLTDNSVTMQTESLSTEVGQANNLNDVSFSANAGIGIDYNINNKLQLNVEPVFKYQLNTFSREDGNFRPYQLGVYTGVSYKF